jgi:hypothetical protein
MSHLSAWVRLHLAEFLYLVVLLTMVFVSPLNPFHADRYSALQAVGQSAAFVFIWYTLLLYLPVSAAAWFVPVRFWPSRRALYFANCAVSFAHPAILLWYFGLSGASGRGNDPARSIAWDVTLAAVVAFHAVAGWLFISRVAAPVRAG